MKKSFWVLPFALMLLAFNLSNAYALSSTFNITPVKSSGSNVGVTTYSLGETAWLMIYAPTIGSYAGATTAWNDSTTTERFTSATNPIATNLFWVAGPTFSAATDTGNWNVNGSFAALKNNGLNMQQATANFKVVTPEPVAMLLYGVGGLPLAFAFLRRRKVEVNV